MSDERWLSKDERAQWNGTPLEDMEVALLDHAEAADELITELAASLEDVLQYPDDANVLGRGIAALARVDALTKDTA